MSKTRLFEAIKTADLQETKRILDAKPELLKVWNLQGRNLAGQARRLRIFLIGKALRPGPRRRASGTNNFLRRSIPRPGV